MRDKHNRTGTAYALTTFTAILPGHVDEVRATIEGVPRGADSPLARLTQLHTSRLQIFDKLVYQGAPYEGTTVWFNSLVASAGGVPRRRSRKCRRSSKWK